MAVGDGQNDAGMWRLIEAAGPTGEGCGHATFAVQYDVDAASWMHALVRSRAMVTRVFEAGQLTAAEGRAVRRGDTLAADDVVNLSLVVTRAKRDVSGEPVDILYQDPFLMAVDKPAGILVHGDGSDTQTLTARVQGELLRQGSAAVPQALHRLDVDTSGIVLFSLTEEFQPSFDALVAGTGLRKRYWAVIEGALPWHDDRWHTIDAPIARDRHDARRMRVGRTGKPAVTLVRTVERHGRQSLVEAELATGRRHQIRVHLAQLGHPLVGDVLYGGARSKTGLQLQAHEVRLVHPVTGEALVVRSQIGLGDRA